MNQPQFQHSRASQRRGGSTRMIGLMLALLVSTLVSVASVSEPVNAADGYNALTPSRVLDTRTGIGAPKARVGAGGHIDLKVTGTKGIPSSGVAAVVLNVTAINPSATTYLTVWPTGQAKPGTSNLNAPAGTTIPNLVIATVGAGGKVSIGNEFGNINIAADITGWIPGTPATGSGPGHLYFSYFDGLGTVDMSTHAKERQVFEFGSGTVYTVNASQNEFVYDDYDTHRVYIRDLDTNAVKTSFVWGGSTGDEPETIKSAPEASPDGTLLISAVEYYANAGPNPESVEIVDRQGNLIKSFNADKVYDWEWTSDSDLLLGVATSVDDPNSNSRVIVMPRDEIGKGDDAKAGTIMEYTGPSRPNHLTVSPDDSQIAYVYNRSLYVMDFDVGSTPRRMAFASDPVTSSAFSPDGRSIALIAPHTTVLFGKQGPIQIIPNHRGAALDVSDDGPYQLQVGPSGEQVAATFELEWTW